MKAYCENCTSLQPSRFRPGNDAVTGEAYEDLRCDTCGFIVATVQEREALAPPEQEPVAGVVIRDSLPTLLQDRHIKQTDERLYTALPQRKPMTYEEITAISKQVAEGGPKDSIDRFVRAIEAKLKE